jgi:GTPase SAR1 family protein
LIVFDLTAPDSLDHVGKWLYMLKQEAAPDARVLLVANKSDLRYNEETLQKGRTAAKESNLAFLQTGLRDSADVLILGFKEFVKGKPLRVRF